MDHHSSLCGDLANNSVLPFKAAFVFPDVLALDLFVLSAIPHPHLLCFAENPTRYGLGFPGSKVSWLPTGLRPWERNACRRLEGVLKGRLGQGTSLCASDGIFHSNSISPFCLVDSPYSLHPAQS